MDRKTKKYFNRVHHIMRLTQKQKEKPETVFNMFFDDLTVDQIRKEMFDWLHCAMANDSGFYGNGMKRSNLVFLYERIEVLVEASFLLYKKNGWYGDKFKEQIEP